MVTALTDLGGRPVTVVGLARSGVCAANLLVCLGAVVTVTDRKKSQELQAYLDKLNPAVRLALGSHPPELFERASLIIVSPGVPLGIAPLKPASGKGIPVIGELELAYQVIKQNAEDGKPGTDFFAITGTNGKSTTTALLYEVFKNSGFSTAVGGNTGDALTGVLFDTSSCAVRIPPVQSVVTEVSSFQLEAIREFRPKGAAILNITPDHLDRYASMEDYFEAKCRVFLNQRAGDFLVLNADDPETAEALKRVSGPEVFFFSRKKEVAGAYFKGGSICFNLPGVPSAFSLQPSTFKIKGVHNIENAMAAAAMALLAGCSADAMADTLESFTGLEHRLEFVRELDGVRYINDSKGTNVGAVMKSLESFREPVILIAGGRDKDSDFTELGPLVKDRVKALVLIGEARDKIRKALGDVKETFMADDLQDAITRARDIASPGDVVLLSPACASFDMFRDFEDRGGKFKEAVMGL